MSKTKFRMWFTAGAVGLGLCLSTSAPAATDVSDPWLTTKVKLSLLTAGDIDGLAINVDTSDARVTLHGTASSAAEKARAEQLARKIEGVREVRNLIQVVPDAMKEQVTVNDSEVETRVKKALVADPALAGSEIEVRSVNGGSVLLGGKAETLSAHLRAVEVARGIEGVQKVESQVESPDRLADSEIWREGDAAASAGRDTGKAASDLWITTAAKVRMLAADLSALDVNVDTRGGVVTLFGSVGTEAEKRTADAEVRKVDGVKQVRNEIQVVPKAQQAAVEHKDEQIREAVEERIETHTGLSDSKIDVEVSNGVVRLTGTVTSQADRLAALTVARANDGVRSVVGDLRVERN